jgi:hypothetical protein
MASSSNWSGYGDGSSNYSLVNFPAHPVYYHYPATTFISRSDRTMGLKSCDGLENFVSDTGILGFVLGWISGIFGLFTLSLSLVNQLQTNLSVYFNGFPTSVLALLGENAPPALVKLWSYIGILDTALVVSIFGPMGDFINLVDYIGNGIGIVGLAVSTFATFPDIIRSVIDSVFEINLKRALQGYGCQNNVNRYADVHSNYIY